MDAGILSGGPWIGERRSAALNGKERVVAEASLRKP